LVRNKPEDIADPGERHKLFKRQSPPQKTPIITQAHGFIRQSDREDSGAKKGKRRQQRLDTQNRLL
jgi:hypothetical protein